jgi:ribonuclease P protein component
MNFKFPKEEKICSKYEIDALFSDGKTLRSGSLSIKFLFEESKQEPKTKFLVVVPKKKVRRAVDRNKLKRQLREVIRLNKASLPIVPNKRLLLVVVYYGHSKSEYAVLQDSYLKMVKEIQMG